MVNFLLKYRVFASIAFFLLWFYWFSTDYSIIEPVAVPEYWLILGVVFVFWFVLLMDMIRT